MATLEVGQRAPAFRLPSGQGPEVGPEDYRGRSNLIVWFTKGMACAFCRQHMSQLARAYPRFKALNTEVLEVTPTKPDRARFYVKSFPIPFPYLCDPDYRVRRSYGLDVRSHSIVWYAKVFYVASKAPHAPPNELGAAKPALGEFPALLADEDMGFFIVDREGVVRYTLAGSYVMPAGSSPAPGIMARAIPGNDEIIRHLEQCEEASPRA
jgi:peroxiredoxin